MSRISLWRIDGNPPRGQFRACSTVNFLPQMQWEGRCAGCQPYRKHSASLKAPLWRANPCSSMGKVESQLEAPFSADTVNALWRLLGSLSLSSEAAIASCCLRRVRIPFLALSCSVLVSDEYVCDCCRMRAISGAVIFSDALLLAVLWREGSMMPKYYACSEQLCACGYKRGVAGPNKMQQYGGRIQKGRKTGEVS